MCAVTTFLFNVFFAAAVHAVLVRFSEDSDIMRDLVPGGIYITVFEAAGLTVSKKKTGAMLLRAPNQELRTSTLVIEAAGLRYGQLTQFMCLGGLVDASADISPEIKRRIRLATACYNRFKRDLCDRGLPRLL